MKVIIVIGAGDIASGVIYKLVKAGFNVIATEIEKPTSIRREICFSEAVYDGAANVEDMNATLCKTIDDVNECFLNNEVAILVDEKLEILDSITPVAVVDSILAKKNLGTTIDMANIVVGVGPGFTAKEDCHAVVETKRGHDLGRIYYEGSAIKNTGIPGLVGGYSSERVFHSPTEGSIKNFVKIGDVVERGQLVFSVDGVNVVAPFKGLMRGIIRDGFYVKEGMKVADIDSRIEEVDNCVTISEKARCIAGAVLEAIMYLEE